jgi:ferrous iron transport protein B
VTPTFVLVGRPNCGKSSLFNLLTGGGAKVANFPGITVDVLTGEVRTGDRVLHLVDLPGLYSVDAVPDPESDEGQAHKFLETEKGARIVQVADATHLGLSLRLFRELSARGARLVVTQRDSLEAEGRTLDVKALSEAIGAPVLLVSARDRNDRDRLVEFITADATPTPRDFDADEVARNVIHDANAGASAIRARSRTERLDAVLLHPFIGPFFFVGLMAALFALVFALADPATHVIDAINRHAAGFAVAQLGDGWLASLLVDGVLGGAGTVLAFLPQIVVLTVALEIVEASGYLARGAFLVDRMLRTAGLGGRSFVPLLTAHACAVPAIGATRIVRDPGQRLRTILVLPLMTCAARIPTYALLIQAFFAHRSPWFRSGLFVGLYFAGILTGLVASLVLGRAIPRAGKSLPLVLEMPSYRMPQLSVVGRTAYRTSKRFLRDVGSGILAASVILWVLLTVPAPGSRDVTIPDGASPRVAAMHRSVASRVGHVIEPITEQAGFDWRIDVGLIGSFGARELMVSTLGVIFGIDDAGDDTAPLADKIRDAKNPNGSRAYPIGTGLALLAFFVIACQCISTLMAIRRETRTWRWPAFVFAYTYACAFVLAIVVNKLSLIL